MTNTPNQFERGRMSSHLQQVRELIEKKQDYYYHLDDMEDRDGKIPSHYREIQLCDDILFELDSLPSELSTDKPPIGEWIAVTDETPRDDDYFLCYGEGFMTTLQWSTDLDYWQDYQGRKRKDEVFGKITHWQPLPTPPIPLPPI